MLQALIIVFREVIEAGLIVGIVLAATKGVPKRGRWVGGGVLCGILGALMVAAFADRLGAAMAGSGQEFFNAGILFFAVCMLGWHNVWMASHGREIAMHMKAVGAEVRSGERPLLALGIVVAVAVLREGSEVVLFLYGIAAAQKSTIASMAAGSLAGLGLGAATSALMYGGLLRIPARHLFRVTGWLITLVAAGMASQAVAFLQQSGHLEKWSDPVWDTSRIVSDGSLTGKMLHALIGYTDQPSGMQLAAYLVTIAAIVGLTRLVQRQKNPPMQARAVTA